MTDSNIFETLGQVSSREAGSVFRDFLRGSVRQMICEVMASEVTELCGPKHRPNDSGYVRAPDAFLWTELVRPRVREEDASGAQQEVKLATYQAAGDVEQLTASIIQALASDVSTREIKNVKPASPGVSQSNVSRHWQQAGHKWGCPQEQTKDGRSLIEQSQKAVWKSS